MLRPFEKPSSPLPTPIHSPWKPYRALVLVLVFHLLGTTWFKNITWNGVAPDFPLCCALCLALLGGLEIGAWAGALAGVLLMWTVWQNPGSLLFSRLLPALVAGFAATRLPPLHPLVPPLVGAASAIVADCAFVLLSPRAMPLQFWLDHALRFALVQALAMWPVMLCVARVAKSRNRLLFG
ncbi:hypothetical protein IAD21_05902 [Abditibacteriota bacterium]|nr:hypothetical protein IAD21_05902 [Abditibacteriota bacterium]